MPRDIDEPTAAERPEKNTIRGVWVEEVRHVGSSAPPTAVPLYLTLPGELGLDIKELADAGLIQMTETGAIADADALRVIAVEDSAEAIIRLQTRYPGLKILQEPLESLLHSIGDLAWPEGEVRELFRAQVVNLDLNTALTAGIRNDQLVFPVLALVRKVAVLHADAPHIEWTLCLTLQGQVDWSGRADALVCQFLSENFSRDLTFSAQARALLGPELYEDISVRPTKTGVRDLSVDRQQRVLMALVPKQIAFDAHSVGWKVETIENLRYVGANAVPMVTWMLRFRWDDRARTLPDRLYREALREALLRRGAINPNGDLVRDDVEVPNALEDPDAGGARI
jgi:hypothetical protein